MNLYTSSAVSIPWLPLWVNAKSFFFEIDFL